MFEKLKELLMEEYSIEEEVITLDAEIKNDLGINSLELAELAVQCEEKFDIENVDEDVHKFVTVRDIVDFLEQQ